VEKPVYIHDTLTQQTFIHDSIYKHDSTFVLVKGDTIYCDRWHTEYKYKFKTDTVREVKEVPVEVITTEIKKVERSLNWWQKAIMAFGQLAIVAVVVILVRWFIKRKIKI
jgi:hypothetical protein